MKDCGDIIRQAARDHAARIAMSNGDQQQTYAQLFERGCRLANALRNLGCRPGDRVAVLGTNSAFTVEQIVGIALGGFVRSALYAHQTAEVNADLADHVDAKILLVDAALAGPMVDQRARMPQLRHMVVYGGDPPDVTVGDGTVGDGTVDDSTVDDSTVDDGAVGCSIVGYSAVVDAAAADDPGVRTGPDDVHVIRFSAGTTGRPKGIVHTVERWLRGGDEYRWVTPQLTEADVYLCVGQLTHAASVFFWPFLAAGARIDVVSSFDPASFLARLESERATFTLLVPTMMQALVAHPDAKKRDFSNLRCVNYAASPISEVTLQRSLDVFGDVLYQMYAQSEAWPITMLLPHQHRDHPRSVGRPTPNVRLTIVDDDGQPVPTGQIGEIAVDSPSTMLEIWKSPAATAERTLPDGSRLTRDMGYLDEEGFLYIADRKDDMIISGGYNIWPAQLENVISGLPGVKEVCVIGVPHARWGETPVAVVVAGTGAPSADDVIAATRDKVGSVQKVTAVEFVDELPKSGLGKVSRREVRERYWQGRTDQVGRA